ncbi:hypothetical protein [Sphingomonas carotinifaciens]|uniref:hypothetical protein n=1 Tax=Sphingomonas carotinifaciens TaxID=1166323 RepID=UPI000DD8B51E|nr:hypothetical protein [Sphingomonas carotinifaciens]
MSYAARLPIAADRYTPCVRTVIFRGIDLRGRTLRMQLRLATDTPGAPLVDLGSVDNAQAQGLALITVTQDGAVPVSTVQIRVNESTMKGLPYSGEMGSATALEYDLITTIGGDKRILMRGAFVIEAGVTGADNAPANRPYGYGSTDGLGGMRTSATLTFGETSIAINIDGADLIAPLKQDAEAARDAAVSARNAAAGERAGAEAARDQAEISRDVATTTQPTYASQAAGEAATTAGKLFVVAPGDGTAQMRRRTAGGSDKLYEFLTNTYVPPVGAPAIRRLLRDRIGETASIKDYVVGKGDVDDTDAYSEAMILGVREWLYPDGCSINISRPVNWLGERTHRFADNARIIAEVEGYGVRALGYPDLLPSVVQDPIPRGSMAFTATNIGDLAVDEDFYLYDVSLQEYDVNTVRKKVGNTIFTKRPINFSFDQPTNTRIYRLANACRNVKVFGGEFRNERQSLTAHALGFLNATDIFLQDTVATKCGGIGIGFEVSMRLFTRVRTR